MQALPVLDKGGHGRKATRKEMTELNERLVRLNDLRGGFWAVSEGMVNLDDLLTTPHPGKIVRVRGNPADAIRYFFENGVEADAIAGWASEDE